MKSPAKARKTPKSDDETPKKVNTRAASSASSIFSMTAPAFLHPYLSDNPLKRDGEWFFLWYSPVWILWFGFIVALKLYEGISDLGYAAIGLSCCLPCILIPIFWPSAEESKFVWYNRYTFRANVWVAAFNFIGNYFWTHYFFALLGASYTFPIKFTFNKIPPVCWLLTQPYFQTYHATSNLVLRQIKRRMSPTWLRFSVICITIVLIASFWSFAETFTIQSVPYYSFVDRDRMYTVGTFFYALYFIVSFPMFFRMEEDKEEKWTWQQALLDSLAAAMIVFTLCDFWRLYVGNILEDKATHTLPFLLQYLQ